MSELLGQSLAEYQSAIPSASDPSLERRLDVGRVIDKRFVREVLAAHKQLAPWQGLSLTVRLAQHDEDYGEFIGYAGFVHDEPIDLATKLQEGIERYRWVIEGWSDADPMPTAVTVVIPPNRYSTEDLGDNTSASRSALMGGDIRIYLDSKEPRLPQLEVSPSGRFLSPTIAFHPSVVQEVAIVDMEQVEENVPHVLFRAV